MSETSTLIGYGGGTIGRQDLVLVTTPRATETHRPIPHHEIVRALIETPGFRHIGVVHDEYAVSNNVIAVMQVNVLDFMLPPCWRRLRRVPPAQPAYRPTPELVPWRSEAAECDTSSLPKQLAKALR
jgi:hypothetical protein